MDVTPPITPAFNVNVTTSSSSLNTADLGDKSADPLGSMGTSFGISSTDFQGVFMAGGTMQ